MPTGEARGREVIDARQILATVREVGGGRIGQVGQRSACEVGAALGEVRAYGLAEVPELRRVGQLDGGGGGWHARRKKQGQESESTHDPKVAQRQAHRKVTMRSG